MSNFAGTDRTVACGAIGTSGQPCVRRVVPGESCGYHPAAPLPESEPRRPKPCSCAASVVLGDDRDMPPRCAICGRMPLSVLVAAIRGAVTPSNATNGSSRCDPSPDSVRGEQLELHLTPTPTPTRRSHR